MSHSLGVNNLDGFLAFGTSGFRLARNLARAVDLTFRVVRSWRKIHTFQCTTTSRYQVGLHDEVSVGRPHL